MKPIVNFKIKESGGVYTVEIYNLLTGKLIGTSQTNDSDQVQQLCDRAEIKATAEIIIAMINARWQNYRRSITTDRVMHAFGRLISKCQMLATFSTPESQKQYIVRVLLHDLHIIAPRNERFHQFPALIHAIENKAAQPDLFTQSH
jgi:hypothetical protein